MGDSLVINLAVPHQYSIIVDLDMLEGHSQNPVMVLWGFPQGFQTGYRYSLESMWIPHNQRFSTVIISTEGQSPRKRLKSPLYFFFSKNDCRRLILFFSIGIWYTNHFRKVWKELKIWTALCARPTFLSDLHCKMSIIGNIDDVWRSFV